MFSAELHKINKNKNICTYVYITMDKYYLKILVNNNFIVSMNYMFLRTKKRYYSKKRKYYYSKSNIF